MSNATKTETKSYSSFLQAVKGELGYEDMKDLKEDITEMSYEDKLSLHQDFVNDGFDVPAPKPPKCGH